MWIRKIESITYSTSGCFCHVSVPKHREASSCHTSNRSSLWCLFLRSVFLKASSSSSSLSPSVSCSSSVVFWVTHLWSFWRAVGTTARLSTLPMQTSEQPNSPSIRRTWATGRTPESWQDRDASQNQRQLGLDGVTSPAAHCPRRLPPGLNQGGTSLVFFFLFFCFIPKERVLSSFSDCLPFFGL